MSGNDAENRQAKEALPEGEWNYQVLFENAAAGIGRSRLSDGKILLANEKLAEMFGYDSLDHLLEEFVAKDHYTGEGKRDTALEHYRQNPGQSCEIEIVTHDGSVVTLQVDGRVDDEAGHLDFMAVDISERKRAETALRESENLHRMLATVSPVGIFHADAEGNVTYVNEKWCEIGDMSVEEAMGNGWNAALHPDDRDLVSEWWQSYIENTVPYEHEQRYRRKDDSTTFCFVQIIQHFDKAGRVVGHVGAVTDISEQKLTEEALRETRDRYEKMALAVDQASEMIVLFDQEDRIVFANQAWRKLNSVVEWSTKRGVTFEQHIRALVDGGFAPRAVGREEEWIAERLEQHRNPQGPFELARQDGKWISINEQVLGDGSTIMVISDVTEIKRGEAALREGEDRHMQAAAMAKLGHWVWDVIEGKCSFCSKETAQMHGVTKEEYLDFTNSAERINEWVHPDDREWNFAIMRRVMKAAEAYDIEYRIIARSGQVRYVREIGAPEFDENGELIRFTGMIQDISGLKEAETAARKAMSEAQDANRAKSNFLSTMSHEIRTPLNGVLGLAQLLQKTELDQDQQKKVDTILASGHTLLAILNDVLDMSRIEAGGLELEDTAFSLRDVISTIATPFQNLADDKGIKLKSLNQIESDGVIKGDPVRLRQIIWNLLSNAIKFTTEGGVTLVVTEVSHVNAQVLIAKDHIVRISITDTGPGISPDRLKAIFDAFSQEDSSITRRYGGTGLGLSIVKQLTELMGGTIEVDSKLDQGTQFDVYLPFHKATKAEVDKLMLRRLHEEIAEISSMKVLVAEDNDVNAMIAHAFLQKFGHEVRIAENGRRAVEIARENWADVILMDIHMPEMDGIEATRVIRSSDAGSMLPIIGLTAEAFSERHALFIEAGMDDVLTKPFTEQQLARILVPYGQRMDGIQNDSRQIVKNESGRATPVVKPEPEPSSDPIGDEEGLVAFGQAVGDEVIPSLLEKAEMSLEKRMNELRRGLETSDTDLINEAAHSIKGSCGSMFAKRISALAALMEEKSADTDAIRDLMPAMEKTASETIDWWRSKGP